MSTNATKLIFKRLVREYEFLIEDLKDIESANSEIKDSFMKELSNIDDDGVLETESMDNMADDWAKSVKAHEEEEKESNKHPDFKSLFRKVVVKCHPDKLGNDLLLTEIEIYKEIYEQSVDANETEDWAKLIRCAIKLEINIPESAYDQISSIESSINKLKERQNNIVNSTAWVWYKTDKDDAKQSILKKHLDLMSMLTKK
jgi:hypothetical protein